MTDDDDFQREMAEWYRHKVLRMYPEPRPKKPRGPRQLIPNGLERGRWQSCSGGMGMPRLPGVYVVILDGHTLERLDSFVTGVVGKRLTYSDLIH